MSYIEVNDLCKEYRVAKTGKGIGGAIKSLFHREYTVKEAVRHVNFSVEKGEIVGYIGPNGAGKSTTLKMLSGILIPTSGTVQVGGIVPYERRRENAKRIGVVFGQRSQLYWDLPVSDTFDLYESLYDIPHETFRKNCDLFTELLDMGGFLDQPVRQRSGFAARSRGALPGRAHHWTGCCQQESAAPGNQGYKPGKGHYRDADNPRYGRYRGGMQPADHDQRRSKTVRWDTGIFPESVRT